MDEAPRTQLVALVNEVKAAALPGDSRHTAAWCVGQLPGLYAKYCQTSESRYAEDYENHTRHNSGDDESVDAEALDDSINDHDERARRSADLHPRAAQRRDDESGNDGGVKAAVRRYSAGDRECDCQR